MGLVWVDNFSQYPLGQLPNGPWAGRSLPTVATQGRNGGQRVTWNGNAMVRSGGGNSTFFRAAYRVDSGGGVLTPIMARVGNTSNTLTSWHWLCGGAWNGFAYTGLVLSEDGAIHAVRGGAFESGPNATNVLLLGSSPPGSVPLRRGWFLLEVFIVWATLGSVTVRVNGQTVLGLINVNTKSPEDYCSTVLGQAACPTVSDDLWPNAVTEFGMGGITRGAQYVTPQGWAGSIDFLALFDADPGDVADMAVADLLPNGDGAVSQSTITGTSPAATRWQSVDDALTPDGDATTVTFVDSTAPDEDEYTLTDLPFGSGVIYGAQVSAIHRVSSPGFSSASLGLSDGSNTRYAAPLFSRARSFAWQASPHPERPAGGAWTVGDFANLRVRVKREV